MKVKVLKGTHQIGGCITEIVSEKGTRILIDFGEDLPDDHGKIKEVKIDGLTVGQKKYDAVFITHSHGDHIGLIHSILDDIPVYVERISKKIYTLLSIFTYKEIRFKTKDMHFKEPISVGDITVTPYFVDHSSYHSAMLLIEADGKRVLHTGDFRSHGLKGNEFVPTLNEIGHVDLLITEATTLTRNKKEWETEEQLMQRAEKVFQKYDQIFILQSSTNIDRLKGFYEISKKNGKTFIEDLFTSNLTASLEDASIPNPFDYEDVYTWIPDKYRYNKSLKFKRKYVYPFYKYRKQKAYQDKKYCFLIKASMGNDLQKLYRKNYMDNACLIYSMWDGYKEKEEIKTFLEECKKCGIQDFFDFHTSGHADIKTIELLNSLGAKKVIPIHTDAPEQLEGVLKNVILPQDNDIIDV